MKAECDVCGKSFEKQGNAKTCGKKCSKRHEAEQKRRWNEANKKNHIAIKSHCVICKKEFEKRGQAKTCGEKCNKQRKAEMKRKAVVKANCVICNKEFNRGGVRIRNAGAKTCGKECSKKREAEWSRQYYEINKEKYSERNRRYRDVKKKKKVATYCLICGKQFEKTGNVKTCGKICRKALRANFDRRRRETNRKQIREYDRHRYYGVYRERKLACNRRWNEANKIRISEHNHQHYKTNKEAILERNRQYYKVNKWAILEQIRQYREANREVISDRRRACYVMLSLEKHGLPRIAFLSHMIDQRIASTQDTNTNARNTNDSA